jgi:hypothetical protein
MTVLGIELKNDATQVKIEWRDLLFNFAELISQTLLVAPSSGGSIPSVVTAAFATLKTVSLTDTLETKAFGLFALSLASATAEVLPHKGSKIDDTTRKLAVALSNRLRSETAAGQHIMGTEFFQTPVSSSLYQVLRSDIARVVVAARGGAGEAEQAAKLDSAFAAAVYRVWRMRADYFGPIATALETPGREVAQLQLDWATYRSTLIEDFEVRPIFGQHESKVSLAEIYVPLDGSWVETTAEGHRVERTAPLHKHLAEWLSEGEASDSVRLVFGGPGSGKSSFAKALASELAARPDKRPILVELQHTNALGDLRQSVEDRLVRDLELFSSDPLAERDSNRLLVLIFDGLDELVVPGTAAANRVADGFVVSLRALLRGLNSAGRCRAKVIVTGRTSIMQSFAKSYEIPSKAALQVCGFVRTTKNKIVDRRPEWWKKFSTAYGHDPATPLGLSAPALEEVTNEPLLCFLLALSGYLTSNWEEAADNPNRIYDRLIGEVWERKWGEGAQGSPGRVGPATNLRTRADFDLLMESMALAAWWGGENRIATKANFDLALSATGAIRVWQEFVADDGDDLTNLALTFYFKKSDSDAQGFEFTHKTFSEYLVGRFLLKQLVDKVTKPLRNRDIDMEEASERWCKFAIQACAEGGVAPFLRNQARFLELAVIDEALTEAATWLSHIISSGLPVHRKVGGNFSALDAANRCGLWNAIASIAALNRAKDHHQPGVDWNFVVEWGEDTSAPARLLTKLVDFQGAGNSQILDLYRMRLAAREGGAFATCLFLVGADAEYIDFHEGILAQAYLSESNMRGANFHHAYLSNVGLSEMDLRDADLTGARFVGADLTGADLRGANLQRTAFDECVLDDAILDDGWWNVVSLESFEPPPSGKPKIWRDGKIIEPGEMDYPNLEAIYEEGLDKLLEKRRAEEEERLAEIEAELGEEEA